MNIHNCTMKNLQPTQFSTPIVDITHTYEWDEIKDHRGYAELAMPDGDNMPRLRINVPEVRKKLEETSNTMRIMPATELGAEKMDGWYPLHLRLTMVGTQTILMVKWRNDG